VTDTRLLESHLALVDGAPPTASEAWDALEAVAEKKIRDARTADEAIAALTPEEQGRVQARTSLLRLARDLDHARPGQW
jgi:hypothetical protein